MPIDQRVMLNDLWEKHCETQRQLNKSATGQAHVPASEGGNAQYDMNLSATYIECRVKGCDWRYSEQPLFGSR